MKANFKKLLSLLFVLALVTVVGMFAVVSAESDVTEVANCADFVAAMESGGNIRLTGSFELTAMATVPAGKTVVLDLNDQTIHSNDGETYHITNNGNLTIRDSGKNGAFTVKASGKNANVIGVDNYGDLTIESGKISVTSNNRGAYPVYSSGPSVTITGGTIEAVYNKSGGIYSPYTLALGGTDSVATISGGTITATSNATSTSTRCAPIMVRSGSNIQITITGGEFISTRTVGANGASILKNDGADNAKLIVKGGTYSVSNAGTDRLFQNVKGYLEVSGGTFKYDGTAFSKNTKLTVTGGTFLKQDGTKNDISTYLAEGYAQNDQGVVAQEVSTSEALVAAMAKDGNIRLTGSFELTAMATVPAGKTVVLDLNDQTIHSNDGETYHIINNGNLTIRDSGKNGAFTVNASGKSANVIGVDNYGDLTIESGKISVTSNNRGAYPVYSSGPSVTITGGTIEAVYNKSGGIYSPYTLALGGTDSVATISGGTITATSNATSTSTRCAPIMVRSGSNIQITITGGEFTSTRTVGANGASILKNDGADNAKLIVKGGTYSVSNAGTDRLFQNVKGYLEVSGGTFKYDGTAFSKNTKLTVTGGTFLKQDGTKNDISTYLSKYYLQNEAGTVVDAPDEAVIGTTGFKTLDQALANSKPGDTITLLADVQLADSVTVAKGVTLDLSGMTLESAAVFGDGQILDSSQTGLLKVDRDKVTFAADNGHLPIYDAAAGGYRMAQVQFQAKPAATIGVFYFRFDLTNAQWETLLSENDIALFVRVTGNDATYAVPQQWLDALYNDTTGRGAIKVTFTGWDNCVHNLTVSASNQDTLVEIDQEVENNDALYPNAEGVYEIWTAKGLQNMASNATKGYSYKLMADIDMGGQDWTPIPSFKGTLDGNGKTISNFTITKANGTTMGFFATTAKEVDGFRTTIRNLHLRDVQIIVDGVDDAVNDNSTVRFVGGIVGENFGDVADCSSVCIVTDKRQLADLKKTYYGTLVGNNAERTTQDADGTTQRTPLGVISGSNALATTVNITASSEDFRNPGTKVNSKMALFLADSVDYATKTAKTAVGIAGNSNRNGIDQTLLWQDLTNSTDLAAPVLQERRETAAAAMYELCTVEWKPTSTMYNYTNYSTANGWGVEIQITAAEQGLLTTNKGIQRGLPYAHSTASLDRFNALVGHYTGALEQWDTNAYFYNTSDSLNDFGREALYDQSGWGLYIGADCIGQVSGAWRVVSAVSKEVSGSVRLVGTADTYPSTKYMNWYNFQPVNDLIFEEPGDLDGNGVADQSIDRHLYVANYYKTNKTHFLDALAMTSKADVLVGYSTKGNGHSIMAISDAVVVRKWNGTVDAKLSYIVTAEQGGSGTDSDGINRYSKVTQNGILKTIEWTSTCCVDRRTTFADLVNDGNGTGTTSWQFFPVTCDVLRNADSEAAIVSLSMDANGQISSSFHIVSTTVNDTTVFSGQAETLKSYRSSCSKLNLTDVHGAIAEGTPVTVQLANGQVYTGVFGVAGLTKAE